MNDPTHNHFSGNAKTPFADFPLADADLCVKCGLCLPHCPTYNTFRHEGDSPRGRIALMQGLAQGAIEPAGATLRHLDGCLVCRACEPVCPAQVPYGRLIDAGRTGLWQSGHRPGALWRLLAFWRRTPGRLAWLTRAMRLLDRTRLAAVLARLPVGPLARVAAYLERGGQPPAAGSHEPSPAPSGTVQLFLGCIARPLDAPVLNATVRVLNAMGYRVDVPAGQGCCGAMDAHAGDAATARRLAMNNTAAFDAGTPVISTASGCGAQLLDYRELSPPADGAAAFAARVHDVMHFIHANVNRLPPLQHAAARVVVHSPCTLRNVMRESGALEVLRGVRGLAVEPLRHRDCCGAAGSYLFEHPATADRLGNALLDALGPDVPDVFATSNIGCALHVRRLARQRGLALRVCHPVELLAAALDAAQV